MAKIVVAGALSHLPAATGWPEQATPKEAENFRGAARQLGEHFVQAKPDVLVGIANDHVMNFDIDNVPDFAINVGPEHWGPSEWFQPWLKVAPYRLKGQPEIAGNIYSGLTKEGVRIAAFRKNFDYDDNYSVPLTLTGLATAGIPLVPIMMNCTVPPVLSTKEAYSAGQNLGKVMRERLPSNCRIALFATGGLSHEPGGPKYFEIDREFDLWFLDLLAKKSHEECIREVTYEKMEAAGSGGTSELLAWFVVMGAIGPCSCNVMAYESPKAWRCGAGVVSWELDVAIPAATG